jgi:uncharacterized membrane protein
MMSTSLGAKSKLEDNALFIVFMALVLMILWHAVWELLTELTQYLSVRYGISKRTIYLLSVLAVLLLIGIFPVLLSKL